MKHLFAKVSLLFIALLTSCDSTYVAKGTITPLREISSTFTRDDLINIAYLINAEHHVYDADRNEITIDPSTMKEAGTLDKETETTILKDYYALNKDTDMFVDASVTLNDIAISHYFGYFNDYHLFTICGTKWDYIAVECEEIISDILFIFPDPEVQNLLCWKENQ